jgi:hypothetical protein
MNNSNVKNETALASAGPFHVRAHGPDFKVYRGASPLYGESYRSLGRAIEVMRSAHYQDLVREVA